MADNIYLVQQDLVKALLDNLPSGYASEQVKLPNSTFTTPKNQKWLRVTTNLDVKENVQASGSYKRTFGVFTVDIFHPTGTGELSALEDYEHIKGIYENSNIGNAKCEEVSTVFNEIEDAWYNIQADVNFYYEGA